LFISDHILELEGRAHLDWYESNSSLHNQDIVELHKGNLEVELRDALSTGNTNLFFQNLWADLESIEWKDLYDSSMDREDFVRKYKKANVQILIAHEIDHIRELLIEGKEYSFSESETRAGLQELLNLPDYNPEFLIDGYNPLAGAVHWLRTDNNDDWHIQAGRNIINCYVFELRKPHEKGNFYADVTNLEENGKYLIALLDLTTDQILEIGQTCNDSLVKKNRNETGYLNPDVTQTFSETENGLLIPSNIGFNQGYLRGNNFYPLSLPHLVADQIHKENISNLDLSPSLRQVA